MEIRKIELISDGDRGIIVSYLKQEEKKGRTFTNEIKEKRKYPIHNDLDQLCKKLRFFMLDITGIVRGDMEETDVDYIVTEAKVTAIKIEGTVFSIIGTKRCDYGTQFKIETPKIDQNDEYPHYDDVWDIIKDLKEETRLYMNGTKAITPEEAVIRMIESGRCTTKGATDWDNMDDDAKKEFCTKVLEEKFGSMVTHMEELTEDIDHEEADDTQVIDLAKIG